MPARGAPGGRGEEGAPTLIAHVYENLRRDIILGKYRSGEKLRVEHVRTGFGVAASTTREALSRLVSDGLVTAEGQRGFRVAPMSSEDLADITRLRILLETEAVQDSMRNGDIAWEGRVVAAFHLLSRAEDTIAGGDAEALLAWEICNQQFHQAVASACGSPRLVALAEMLFRQHERYRMQSLLGRSHALAYPFPSRDVLGEHRVIMTAAIDRDFDAIRPAIALHIGKTAESVGRRLGMPFVAASTGSP